MTIVLTVQLNDISFANKDTFRILVNDDLDYFPIIMLAIVFDAPGNENFGHQSISVETGNIAGEKRAFDKNWRPKKIV